MTIRGAMILTAGMLALFAEAPAAAQSQWDEVQPRRTRDYDERKGDGYCSIRVWVDNVVVVHLRGDRVAFETLAGQRAKDGGTECSQPMPSGSALADFEFKGIDGRGRVELIERPDSGNRFTAKVRIEDSKSGGEEHHFRLSWRNLRPGSTTGSGGWDQGPNPGGNNRPGGGNWGNPGGGNVPRLWTKGASGWGRTFRPANTSSRGNGEFTFSNGRVRSLDEARVEIQSDGRVQIEFSGEAGAVFAGRVIENRGDAYLVRVNSYASEDADGEAQVYFRGGRLQNITLEGENSRNRSPFRAEFSAN